MTKIITTTIRTLKTVKVAGDLEDKHLPTPHNVAAWLSRDGLEHGVHMDKDGVLFYSKKKLFAISTAMLWEIAGQLDPNFKRD